MKKNVIAAVLAGGLGTRLRPLTLKIPKPLVRINGKPFIHFLLSKVASLGIKECILLTGYKHEMIWKYCKDGKKWGLKISYSIEPSPLGTGGALVFAKEQIKKTVLMLNGDSFVDFDFASFLSFHKRKKALASIYCMHGSLDGRGEVKVSNSGQVISFAEKQSSGFGYFNTGVYLIEPEAIEIFAKKIARKELASSFSLEKEGFPIIMRTKSLYSYFGGGRFLDIGTFEALEKAQSTLSADWVLKSLKRHSGTAVFLDRDGVVNRHKKEYVKSPQEFEFEKGAIAGMKKLAKAGLPIFIITNQSMVGRGLATKEALKLIHGKMLSSLGRHRIKIADILVCPHKPEDNCRCRKPKIGMLIDAKERFGVDLKKSFVIGDSTGDIEMGNQAGCTTILVSTGYGGKDLLHDAKPDFVCKDLREAADLVLSLLLKFYNL